MRKIVVLTFISLDGVMQAPGGPQEDNSGDFKFGGWTAPFSNKSSGEIMMKQMTMPFDLLLGTNTYEIFAAFWPKNNDNPIGKSLNSAKKYVVSDKDMELKWEGSTLIKDDVVNKLKDLKNEDGPMLQVHGSSLLIQTLLKNDLVDELWLKIFPLTLGSGKKLFGEGTIPAAFELTESKILDSGVIIANYKRNGEVKTGTLA
jgi:dihydrofolate reductase